MTRKTAPRDFARDSESWPRSVVDDAAAEVVQAMARALADALEADERSLRQFAAGSGVKRQAIADLLVGRCWPDVATVVRLENFLAMQLYPLRDGIRNPHENRPFRPQWHPVPGTAK
ncbi:helix-turn-helix domain-containing protein [Streptomyces sp. NPDC093514]|uniref:helix-turn-helix domain-containing protein n=1 Tax=Streptomyces sp. NPDC093514 TaxID=3366039 RepID=UPI0037FE8C09